MQVLGRIWAERSVSVLRASSCSSEVNWGKKICILIDNDLSYRSSPFENPHCDSGCANGQCTAPNVCGECFDGYILDESALECNLIEVIPDTECDQGFSRDVDGVCHKLCDIECYSGKCLGDRCQCLTGYSKINETHCGPECDPPCMNGVCVGPNKCLCDEDFQTLFDAQCKPKCEKPCMNGTCVGDNQCECHKG